MQTKGNGVVQKFVAENGGSEFLTTLMARSPFKSMAGAAKIIREEYNFFCTDNTIRIIAKQYGLKCGKRGGNRRNAEKLAEV